MGHMRIGSIMRIYIMAFVPAAITGTSTDVVATIVTSVASIASMPSCVSAPTMLLQVLLLFKEPQPHPQPCHPPRCFADA
jgi:hypothetical protein